MSLPAYPPPLDDVPAVARHDRVRVPDGRTGEVIGFCRAEDDRVLVLFDGGGSRRYVRADIRLLV